MLVDFVRRFSKMSFTTKIKPLLFLSFNLLICTFLFTFLPVSVAVSTSEDYTSLDFNGCSAQMFPNNVYPENLKPLMESLVSNSSLKPFFAAKTTSSDGTNGIEGLYQCRGDRSPAECNTCVSKIPPLVNEYCGQTSVASRVQLRGCYLHYEIAGAKSIDAAEYLFKRCDVYEARAGGLGVKRDTAFGIMENSVKTSTSTEVGGLYTGSYDTVNVAGQCEGSLANEDCVACLQSASQKAKTECGDSISGEIYLYKCYIRYSTSSNANANANGVTYPRKVHPGSGKDRGQMKAAIGIVFSLLVGFVIWSIWYYIKKRRE